MSPVGFEHRPSVLQSGVLTTTLQGRLIESSKLLDNPAEPLSHSAAVCQPRSILEHLRAV